MSPHTNSQPLSRQFTIIRGRRALEPNGAAPGFPAHRSPSAIECHRRIKEKVPC